MSVKENKEKQTSQPNQNRDGEAWLELFCTQITSEIWKRRDQEATQG